MREAGLENLDMEELKYLGLSADSSPEAPSVTAEQSRPRRYLAQGSTERAFPHKHIST